MNTQIETTGQITRQTTETLTKRLFTQPTAPFRESFVLAEIKSILEENKIPYFEDSVGQIIAGVSNTQKLKSKTHVAFFAHTDHPGFIIDKKISQKNNQTRYKATWYGGAPFHQMEGKPVRIFSDQSATKFTKGTIKNFKPGNHREGIPFEIETVKELKTKNNFGAFNFDGYKYKKGFVHTKCADDLAGCVMALGALIDVQKLKTPAIAVFTRAEEVGFVGCLHMIKSKVIPLNTMVVSLEASRTLPGALLGEGPVIRLGDASTLFDSNFSLFIQKQAQELKAKDPKFKFQKRIMDGGSCEATALSQFGYKTMGLAVPLKNYHNQGTKGPAPEIIHLEDAENGRKLLTQVAKNLKTFKTVGPDLQKRLMVNLKNLNKMLDWT
jgi:putative aminopeptidase FrvX